MNTARVIDRCPVCHSDVRPGMIHCRECHATLMPDVGQQFAASDSDENSHAALKTECAHCGAEMRRGMVGCRECGHRVNEAAMVRSDGNSQGDNQLMAEMLKQAIVESFVPEKSGPEPSITAHQETGTTESSDRKPCFACGTLVEPDWVCCPRCQVSLLPVKPKRRARAKATQSDPPSAEAPSENLSVMTPSVPEETCDLVTGNRSDHEVAEVSRDPQSVTNSTAAEKLSSTPVAVPRKLPAAKSRSTLLNFPSALGRRSTATVLAVVIGLTGIGLKSTVFRKVHRTVLTSSSATAMEKSADSKHH